MLNNQWQFSKAWKVFRHLMYEYFQGTIDFSHPEVFNGYYRRWRSLDLSVNSFVEQWHIILDIQVNENIFVIKLSIIPCLKVQNFGVEMRRKREILLCFLKPLLDDRYWFYHHTLEYTMVTHLSANLSATKGAGESQYTKVDTTFYKLINQCFASPKGAGDRWENCRRATLPPAGALL